MANEGGRDGPTRWAAVLCALLVAGCATTRVPRIDPTGERFFVVEPAATGLGPMQASPMPATSSLGLIVHPPVTIAPIRSEVALLAAVRGADQYLRTNERIEWVVDPATVGGFVDIDRGSWTYYLVGDFNGATIFSPNDAVNSTSRRITHLPRPTVDGVSLPVLPGQTWISLTSPCEGTSRVTATAPYVRPGETPTQMAFVHWIDAEWALPSPAIVPAGSSHRLATTVSRISNQSPRAGWTVRYRVASGPPAGFAPAAADEIEITTGPDGSAAVELVEKAPAAGTSLIAIDVFRPADSCGNTAMRVGGGSVVVSWSAPGLSVRVVGPPSAAVGTEVAYRLEVTNSGDQPLADVIARMATPAGMALVASAPTAQQLGSDVLWSLGTLGPAETRPIDVRYRAEQTGSASVCGEATAAAGLAARHCLVTNVVATAVPTPAPVGPLPSSPAPGPSSPVVPSPAPSSPAPVVPPAGAGSPSLDLQVRGPSSAKVGEQVTFEIVVQNRGTANATGLVIRDDFDPGFEHSESQGRIERELGTLAVGQSRRIGVVFRVRQAGRLCHRVEIRGDGGIRASEEGCLTAAAAAQPPSGPPAAGVPPAAAQPPATPTLPATVDVNVIVGAAAAQVGDTVRPRLDIINTGQRPLTNVKLACTVDPQIRITKAFMGFEKTPEGGFVWTIASLAPGKSSEFYLEGTCAEAAAKACVRAAATSDEGARDEEVACLEVRRPPAMKADEGLTVDMASLSERVSKGQDFTVSIVLTNNGAAAQRQLTLAVDLPPQMSPVRLGSLGPTAVRFSGRRVEFEPIESLPRGQSARYRLRVRAADVGEAVIQARVQSESLRLPLLKELATNIAAG